MKQLSILAMTCCLLAACSETLLEQPDGPADDGGNLPVEQKYSVDGNVQKGPFTQGTSISIQPLDENLNPTGKTYQTKTTDDAGTFGLDSQIESRFIEIIASGYYFNENTGKVSSSTLTLRSLSDLEEEGRTNVNLLTTLEYDRIRNIVKNHGKSIHDARRQAEQELLAVFHIPDGMSSAESFDKMDITKAGESNAILLAISASLQGQRSEGELSELVSKIASELSGSGKVESELLTAQIREGGMTVEEEAVRSNLTARYNSLGIRDYTIPPFEDYLDINGNGTIDKLDKWLIMSEKEIQMSDLGGNFEVEVKSNLDYDIIIEDCDWILQGDNSSTKSYLESKILSFTVLPNETYSDRSAAIRVKDAASGEEESLTVYQKQHDALTVTSDRFEVDKEGGFIDIEVKANVDYEVEIDPYSAMWITPEVQTKALLSKTLRYSIAPNEESGQRIGTIRIIGGSLEETVKIYQTGEKVLVLGTREHAVSDKGGSFYVDVTSNIEYDVLTDAGWITAGPGTKGIQTGRQYFTIQPNEEYEDRTAHIIFREKNGTLQDVVTVNQMQKDAIIIANNSYQFSNAGGHLELKFQTNVDITVEIPEESASWIRQYPLTKGMTNWTITFLIEKNTAYDKREGEIIIKCESKGLSKTVKVLQGQQNAIFVTEHEHRLPSAGGNFSVEVKSNIAYDVEITGDATEWIHPVANTVATKGLSSNTLTFSVERNPNQYIRSGIICVVNREHGIVDNIVVIQAAKETIIVDRTYFDIGREGGIIPVTVKSNVDYEVTIGEGEEWISVAPNTKSLTETVVNLSIAPNQSAEARAGKVTIEDKASGTKDNFTINQAGNTEKITLHVEPAGTLHELITRENLAKYEQVTVTGFMNADDVELFGGVENNMIEKLDVSGVEFENNTLGGFNFMDKLTEVHLPPTLKIMRGKNGTFSDCPLLSVVDFGENPQLEVLGTGIWYNADGWPSPGFRYHGAFSNCPSLVRMEIPSSVYSIEPGAFAGQSVKELIIPADSRITVFKPELFYYSNSLGMVLSVSMGTFIGNSSIETIQIPAGVKIIEAGAFYGWTGLKHLEIPESVIVCDTDNLFKSCSSLETVSLPKSAKGIVGANMFRGCNSLKSFTFAGGYTSIGDYAFADCQNLTTVSLDGVTKYGKGIFQNCGIEFIRIPDDMTEIPNGMFFESKLKAVDLNKTEIIGTEAFIGCCDLESVKFSPNLKRIEAGAFGGDWNIYQQKDSKWPVSLTLPSSVEFVGEGAFAHRNNLKEFKITSERIVLGDNICGGTMLEKFIIGKDVKSVTCENSGTHRVLKGIGTKDYTGSNFNNIIFEDGCQCEELGIFAGLSLSEIELPPFVKKLSAYAFEDCTNIRDANFANILKNIEEIGERAFAGCSGLQFVTIPESVKRIGKQIFGWEYELTVRGLTILGSAELGEQAFASMGDKLAFLEMPNVVSIGIAAFAGTTLPTTSLSLPNLTTLGERALEGQALTSVDMPNLTTIGELALAETGLKSFVITEKIQSIAWNCFSGCQSLEKLIIDCDLDNITCPSGTSTTTIIVTKGTRIGKNAFSSNKCKAIELPQTINEIGEYAFSWCPNLTSINLHNITSIGEYAFTECNALTSINLSNVTSIGRYSFSRCKGLISVDLPNVTSIGGYAFTNCTSLSSISFPKAVTILSAFERCSSLKSIEFPASLKELNLGGLTGCTGLIEIISKNPTPPSGTSYTPNNVPTDIPVYVPKGSSAAYKAATGWKDFTNYIEKDF